MSNCRVTVLFYSLAKRRVCFNPLVSLCGKLPLARLKHVALEKYFKKTNQVIPQGDVLSMHVLNAGIMALITDDTESLLETLGTESTVTLMFPDCIDLMSNLPSIPHQLMTPVPSTPPSLDLNNFLAISSDNTSPMLKQPMVTVKRKFSDLQASRNAPISAHSVDKQAEFDTCTRRRRKRKRVSDATSFAPSPLAQITPRAEEDLSGQQNKVVNTDVPDDDFQFSRPRALSQKMQLDYPSEPLGHSTNKRSTGVPDCYDEAILRQLSPSSSALRNEQTTDALASRPPSTASEHGTANINVAVRSKETSIPRTHASALTESNLKLISSQKSPLISVAAMQRPMEVKAISVESSSVHDSHIQQTLLSTKSASSNGKASSDTNEQAPSTIGPLAQSTPNAEPVELSGTRTDFMEDDDSGESALADFLSVASSPSPVANGSDLAKAIDLDESVSEHVASASTVQKDLRQLSPASDDSSSMKSGTHNSGISSSSEKSDQEDDGAEAQSVNNELDHPENEMEQMEKQEARTTPERQSFEKLGQASPDYTQQSEPIAVTQQGTQSEVHLNDNANDYGSEAVTRRLATRPGLRGSYKPLSFLHDQSMRQKDDMLKLASSPRKVQLDVKLADDADTDHDDNEDDEDTSDSSSSSSPTSDDNSNLPPGKSARSGAKRKKKRQSQGAKGLIGLI